MCCPPSPLSIPSSFFRRLRTPCLSLLASSFSSVTAKAPPSTGLHRLLIGLVGEMNAGKSTCLNALTQQATSIVDATPGTTADVKAALLELHGLGPVKLLDTAGIDDVGALGEKKKERTYRALKEIDVALVVIDPFSKILSSSSSQRPYDGTGREGRRRDEGGGGIGGDMSESAMATPPYTACQADPSSLSLLSSLVQAMDRRGRRAMLVFNLKKEREEEVAREGRTSLGGGGGERAGEAGASAPWVRELINSIEECIRRDIKGQKSYSLRGEEGGGRGQGGGQGRRGRPIGPSTASASAPVRRNLPFFTTDGEQEGSHFVLLPSFTADFTAPGAGKALALHLLHSLRPSSRPASATSLPTEDPEPPLLPLQYHHDKIVLLNIPMDAETPLTRLLRPQALLQAFCLHHYIPTIAYRMNLSKARSFPPSSPSPSVSSMQSPYEEEKAKFLSLLSLLPPGSLVVTDSQAIDVVHAWTLPPLGGDESFTKLQKPVDITTFSIVMIQHMSGGRLGAFVEGMTRLVEMEEEARQAKEGKEARVLIAEACNHVRIPEACDDIGTVQLPQALRRAFPHLGFHIHHAYGREFPWQALQDGRYDVVVHCGGCMIDRQKVRARMEECADGGVATTNYGLLLAYAAAPQAMLRAVRPFGVEIPEILSKHATMVEQDGDVGRRASKSGSSCLNPVCALSPLTDMKE